MYRNFIRPRNIIFFLFLIGVSCGSALGQSPASPPATAQRNAEASDQTQTLRALLEEVRRLRQALERSQNNSILMQVIAERLRLQQDAVNRLAQRLDEARSDLAASQLGLARLPEHIADIERRMNGAEDSGQRAQIESELKAAQLAYDDQKERADRLSGRVEQIKSQLQEEQHKLDDLFERLTQFEQPPSDQMDKSPARP